MIHTDTDGGVIGFTDVQEGNEAVAYLPDLLRVLLIGIFQMLEGACKRSGRYATASFPS